MESRSTVKERMQSEVIPSVEPGRSRPFLPEALVGASGLEFLSPSEKLALNQIRGQSYLQLHSLLQGSLPLHKCPMAVLLMSLHLEWLTQRHSLASVPCLEELDPFFRSLLLDRRLEDSRHAGVDELKVKKWARLSSPSVRARAVAEYFEMLRGLDALLVKQVKLDLGTLIARTGRILTDAEREAFSEVQHRSYRDAFMVTGMAESLLSDVLRELWAGSSLDCEATPVIARFDEMATWGLNG
jgi:hypothetical protein